MSERPLPIVEEDQAVLRRLLARNRGEQFRLVVIQGRSPSSRATAQRWLEHLAAEHGLPTQTIDARGLPGGNLLDELTVSRRGRQGGILFLVGLEGLTGSDPPAIARTCCAN